VLRLERDSLALLRIHQLWSEGRKYGTFYEETVRCCPDIEMLRSQQFTYEGKKYLQRLWVVKLCRQ
jgi:hypothetical protein